MWRKTPQLLVAISFLLTTALFMGCATAPNPKTDPWGALAHHRKQIWANPTDISDDDSYAERVKRDRARIEIWRRLLEPARARLVELIEQGERAKALQLVLELNSEDLFKPGFVRTGTFWIDDFEALTLQALEVGLGLEGPTRLPLIESVMRWSGVMHQLVKQGAQTHIMEIVQDKMVSRAHDEMGGLIEVGEWEAALTYGANLQALNSGLGRERCGEASHLHKLKEHREDALVMLIEPYLERSRSLQHTYPRLAQLYGRAAAFNASLVGRVANYPTIDIDESPKKPRPGEDFQPRPFSGLSVPVVVRSVTGCPVSSVIPREIREQLERKPKGAEPAIELDIAMTRCRATTTSGPKRRSLEQRVTPRTTIATREVIDFTVVDQCKWSERCKVFQAGGRPCPDHLVVYDWFCRKVKKPIGTHMESRKVQVHDSVKVVVEESIDTVTFDLAANITLRYAGTTKTFASARLAKGKRKRRIVDGYDQPAVSVGISPDAARRRALGGLFGPVSTGMGAVRRAAVNDARGAWQAEEAARRKLVTDARDLELARYERTKAAHAKRTKQAFQDGALELGIELALQGRAQYGLELDRPQNKRIRDAIRISRTLKLPLDKRRFEDDLQDQFLTTRAAKKMTVCGQLARTTPEIYRTEEVLAEDAAKVGDYWKAELDALVYRKERAALPRGRAK